MSIETLHTRVLIIGGGATGTGLARDLALRGVECLLLEKRDLATGASGGNHGLLHSGARYVGSDPHSARECMEENELLRRLAPQCIEETGGLFVAVPGDDEEYIARFPDLCARSGIPTQYVDPGHAREREPALAADIIAAYQVRDCAVDPFMLTLDNMAHAVALGAQVRRNARIARLERNGSGRIARAFFVDEDTGQEHAVEAELVVNATGSWAGIVAGMAGVGLTVLYSSGTLAITQDRLARRVINRLRPASNSDIVVPGGTVSILGTTSVRIDSPDHCRPSVAEVDEMIEDAAAMIPVLETTRYIRAYAGVRPLVDMDGHGDGDDRHVSRGFALIDHAMHGVENFVTITGGKLTTYRLMAEKTADLACAKLGVRAACTTHTVPLPASASGEWTEPGKGPRAWTDAPKPGDLMLCECEMVSASVVDQVVARLDGMRGHSLLKAVGQRSRMGRGPCQGGFCGPRVTAHLYDTGHLKDARGLDDLKAFIDRRWRGKRPVLWGKPLQQADLQEALHCVMFELDEPAPGAGSAAQADTEPSGPPEETA